MTENWLSTKQVADRLKITVQKVRLLIYAKDNPMPAHFERGTHLIPESELLRWMDAHKIRRQ